MNYDVEKEKLREERIKIFKELGFQKRNSSEYIMTREFTLPECVALTVNVVYILDYEYLVKHGEHNKEKIEIKAVMTPLSSYYDPYSSSITIYREQLIDYNIPNEVYKNLFNEIILCVEEELNAVLHLERIA